MKTGGTMNFLKRAGAILMVVAIFASSCNKYDDDFEQINNKLDLLAGTVQGVTTLNADLTALKTQVTALQTAVAALPAAQTAQLKVETDKILLQISAITTTLGTVATAGNASKLVVDQLKLDLAALTLKVTNDNAAMTTKLTTLGTSDVAQTAQLDALIAANADLLTKIAAIQADMDAAAQTGTNADLLTALTIGGLQAMLNAQKLQLEQILANTSMYTGAVSILTDTDVDFYMLKIAQMNVINGPLTVNPALVTKMIDLNTILSKVTAIVGSNPVILWASPTAAKALNLSNLVSISGSLTIEGAAGTTQTSVDISKLSTVSGHFVYELDGAINLPLLSNVGGSFTFTPYTTSGTTVVGTTSVNLPMVAVTGTINGGTVTLPSATSVIMPATGLVVLSAVNATTLSIVNTATAAAAGLVITPKSTGTVTASFTSAAGTLKVADGTTVNLSMLSSVATGGSLEVNTVATGTVNLDAFNANVPVKITGAKTVSMPLWTGGSASSLVAPAATTVTLPVHTWAWGTVPPTANLNAVATLTVGNANAAMDLTQYPTLVTVNVTGKSVSTWATLMATVTTGTANTALKTVSLGGMLKTASITEGAVPTITSLTTSGVINGFTLDNADLLTTITLDHSGFTSVVDGTPGAHLIVQNNALATTLTASALDKVVWLNVNNNAVLRYLNFPALVGLANTGVGTSVSIVIAANALRGTFTPAVAAVPGISPYVEAVITAPELLKLKPYLTLVAASAYATKTYNVIFDQDTAGVAYGLVAAMVANDGVSAAIDQVTMPAYGINVATEIAIIQ